LKEKNLKKQFKNINAMQQYNNETIKQCAIKTISQFYQSNKLLNLAKCIKKY